jgi:NifU-like protein involved in Fe-S cluster formation
VDEAVMKHYRRLLRTGFENAGSFHDPSIFLDSVGEGIRFCGGRPADYMNIFINVSDNVISDIKYLCSCDPTANIAVEVLCNLVKGKTLEEVTAVREDSFYQVVGSRGEEIQKKTKGLLALLDRGLTRYRAETQPGRVR